MVFGVGPPAKDDTWQRSVDEFLDVMRKAQKQLKFGREDRRGAFQTIAAGISYGGGQMVGIIEQRCNVLIRTLSSNREI